MKLLKDSACFYRRRRNEDMGNKKVLMIPPVSVFSRYARARDGLLRMAVYDERPFPKDTLQMRYYNILRLKKEWQLVGVFTDDSSNKNKNDFRKLMKLCERRKVDMILCSSQEHLSEKAVLLIEMGIPIYALEESRIIDNNEAGRNIPMFKSQ